jgi:hypothetical protein
MEKSDRVDGRLFTESVATARMQLGDGLFRPVKFPGHLAVIH